MKTHKRIYTYGHVYTECETKYVYNTKTAIRWSDVTCLKCRKKKTTKPATEGDLR